jgi:hypothetical protein
MNEVPKQQQKQQQQQKKIMWFYNFETMLYNFDSSLSTLFSPSFFPQIGTVVSFFLQFIAPLQLEQQLWMSIQK